MKYQTRTTRVAITGAGVVTSIGVGITEFGEALRVGRQGISKLTGVHAPRGKDLAGQIYEPKFEGLDRGFLMAHEAVTEALCQSNLDIGLGEDIALILSTIGGDSRAAEDLYHKFVHDSLDNDILNALTLYPNNSILNALRTKFGLFGPGMIVTNACASGNIALGIALDMIRLGRCKAAVVVGVENIKLSMIWGAERSGFVGHALRPFHSKRDGSVLGEGAAALIVEHPSRLEHRDFLGWLEGFGCVCDRGAAPITLLQDGSGLYRSMALALKDASRSPEDIEYVNAHAPGTKLIDKIECKAVADLCGTHASTVAINATKSLTAHLSGASAIVEAVATLIQMRDCFLHPTVGLDDPDPDLLMRPVGQHSIERRVTRSISNACGGGGLNTSIFLSAPQEQAAQIDETSLSPSQRVVITGIGCLSIVDTNSLNSFSDILSHDDVNPSRIDNFDIYDWYPKETNYAYMNRAAQLAAAASAAAISDAKLRNFYEWYRDEQVAVLAGTYLGGGPEASEVMCKGLMENAEAIRPSMSLDHGLHLGAALVCRFFGLTGSTYTLTGTSTTGLQAVIVARDLILAGRAEAAIAMGYDAFDSAFEHAISLLGNCSFGNKLGEGSGAVVLERLETARARRAPRSIVIGDAIMLNGSFRSLSLINKMAERLAEALLEDDWEYLYIAGPLDPRLDILAEKFSAAVGKPITIRRLQSRTNYCFAADPLIAMTAAVERKETAAILSAEINGAVAALVIKPE